MDILRHSPGELPLEPIKPASARESVRGISLEAVCVAWCQAFLQPRLAKVGAHLLQAAQHFCGAQLRERRPLGAFQGMKSNVLLHMPTAAELPVSALLDLGLAGRCNLRLFMAYSVQDVRKASVAGSWMSCIL